MTTEERPTSERTGWYGWYDRQRGPGTVIAGWLVTRALIIVILVFFESFVVGDVFYYQRKIAGLFDVGLGQTLMEYPTPVVWILWLPYAVSAGNPQAYLVAFMLFMLALDAVFTLALYRTGGRRHDAAIDFWILFVFLIGPLSYLRFDVLPAVLAGGALLAARRRPWITGALTGLGAAVKLWPALLIAAFCAHRPDRRVAALWFVIVGFGLAALSLVTGGLARLFSPLTWQSGRGLQIESVWATPLMLARAFGSGWQVDYSRYQAYEIFGPGVGVWLQISNLATLAGLVVLVVLWIRAYRNPVVSATAVGLVVLATVAIMTITNKTLSPQYLLWLGGPMAALLVLRRGREGGADPPARRLVNRLAVHLLVLALLTQLVYPLLYDGLLGFSTTSMMVVATSVTAIRNLALLAFTVEACRAAWIVSRHGEGQDQSPTGTESSLA